MPKAFYRVLRDGFDFTKTFGKSFGVAVLAAEAELGFRYAFSARHIHAEKIKMILLKFLIAKELHEFDLDIPLQILERQGLARKFFQYKDLSFAYLAYRAYLPPDRLIG